MAKKVTVIPLGQLNDDLLDTIHGMLKSGELAHAPADYYEARRKLQRRRKAAAMFAMRERKRAARRAKRRASLAMASAWFYLSFSGSEGWRGAAFVEARSAIHAPMAAHRLGCNPGGEIMFVEVPPEKLPPATLRGRLLNRDELAALGPVKHYPARKAT